MQAGGSAASDDVIDLVRSTLHSSVVNCLLLEDEDKQKISERIIQLFDEEKAHLQSIQDGNDVSDPEADKKKRIGELMRQVDRQLLMTVDCRKTLPEKCMYYLSRQLQFQYSADQRLVKGIKRCSSTNQSTVDDRRKEEIRERRTEIKRLKTEMNQLVAEAEQLVQLQKNLLVVQSRINESFPVGKASISSHFNSPTEEELGHDSGYIESLE